MDDDLAASAEGSSAREGDESSPGIQDPPTSASGGPKRLVAWMLLGVAAAGIGLAVSELFAAYVTGARSLITSVGELLIPVTPVPVVEWAKSTFGTDDKPVLNAGTMLITMGVGAVAGIQARVSLVRAVPFVTAFVLVGLYAALINTDPDPVAVVTSVLLTGGTVLGVFALGRIVAGARPLASGAPLDPSRRSVLATGAGTGLVAIGLAALAGRRMSALDEVPEIDLLAGDEGAERPAPELRPEQSFDIEGLAPLVIPNDDFYLIDTALRSPRIDPATWSLKIAGMVDRPYEITYAELLDMDHIEAYVTLSCVSNPVGGDLVGNAKWRGVKLTTLLDRAGVQPQATEISSRSVDDWFCKFPIETLDDDRDAMVALFMNDEVLPRPHGFPARIVVPGLYGFVSATKWLDRIEPTTDFVGYWDTRGWSETGDMKTLSRVDVPREGQRVPAGDVTLAGVAWLVHTGIDQVQLRVAGAGQRLDEAEWEDAQIAPPISDDTWVQWKHTRALTPGRWSVQVRAIDGAGNVQPVGPKMPRPDGAEGWHERQFSVI